MENKNNLPESAVEFLNYKKVNEGRSEGTVTAYGNDLKVFFDFLKIHKKVRKIGINVIRDIKLKDLNAFMVYLEDKCDNKECARTRKVSTLKSYFDYMQNISEEISSNPAYKLRTPKLPKRNPVYLTLEETKQVLTSMNRDDYNYQRDYCIVTLFLQTGMRLSELEGIKLDKIKGDILTVIGKGNKERTIYLNELSLNVLSQYLDIRDKYNINDGRLFDIKKRAIENVVKKYVGNSGINEASKYTCHKLRHTSATLMYKYGKVDIRSLKDILGHSSVSTTQIYTHVDDESLREAVKKNPLNNL